jgi:hypothetical protein
MKRPSKPKVGSWPNMRSYTAKAVAEELIRARQKHPTRGAHTVLCQNYLRELVKAIEDNHCGKQSASQIFACAMAVAAMAIRIAEEGTFGFKYADKFELEP